MAFVFRKNGSKYWWAGWTDSTGTPRTRSTKIDASTGRGKTEARNRAIEFERKAYRVRHNLEEEVGEDTLFQDRALEWLEGLPADYRTKDTAETYLRLRIFPFIGQKGCRAIGREDVRQMLKANEKTRKATDIKGRPIILRPAKAATREKIRALAHTIFEWLIDDLEVVLTRNPAGGKRLKVKPPKRLPRYVPVPELLALLKEIPEHYRLLCVFAAVSGVRRGELIPLTWADVELDTRRVFIRRSRGFDTTKGKKERFVVIPLWLLPVFESERARGFSQLVFPNAKGKRHRFDVKLALTVRRAAKRAGLITGFRHMCRRKGCKHREELPTGEQRPCPKCSFKMWAEPIPKHYLFKDLRSTFATLAAAESGDLRYVQQMLGHGALSTTETSYIHAISTGLVAKTDALKTFEPLAGAVSGLAVIPVKTPPNGAKPIQTNGLQTQTEQEDARPD